MFLNLRLSVGDSPIDQITLRLCDIHHVLRVDSSKIMKNLKASSENSKAPTGVLKVPWLKATHTEEL